MKRNHDFSSSDSELDETIEVEKESADENGQVITPFIKLIKNNGKPSGTKIFTNLLVSFFFKGT